MKHIKKKYLFEDKLKNIDFDNNESFEKVNPNSINSDFLKSVSKSKNVVLNTDLDEKILAFIYNNNGSYITIPLPDFTLVYYDFAYKLNIKRKEISIEVFKKLNNYDDFSEVNGDLIYNFYGYSSSCIINLFTSMESFINSMLPHDKKFIKKLNNKTEIYDREQIQFNIPFFDKLKKVLPQFYENKNFFNNPTPANNQISKLKELRDKIIYTKSDSTGEVQIELFKELLKFDYDKTFVSVKKLINFYKPDYIIDCPCEKNF
ncbi:MAG: hypothetical protein IE891_05105 [Flavobacteriaceae bacterium]|nr:hypothetical protein [Flavobacteriaceae bacterium]